MSALLLNLVACQSLRSVPRRRSLSLVESILGDPVGPGEKARRKFSSTGGRPFRPCLKRLKTFVALFSPGQTDCPWVSEDESRMINYLCVVCVWEPDASYLINRVKFRSILSLRVLIQRDGK